jgi:hypothetical protein
MAWFLMAFGGAFLALADDMKEYLDALHGMATRRWLVSLTIILLFLFAERKAYGTIGRLSWMKDEVSD